MLVDEQARELEDLLAKSLPAAAAVLTQLLDSADEAVRLDAAKALFESWKYLKGSDGLITQVPVQVDHHNAAVPLNGAAEKPQVDDKQVEELLSQVMGNEEDLEDLAGNDDEDLDIGAATAGKSTAAGTQSRLAPGKGAAAKSSPAAPPARGGPQEKPPAKTKPKQADEDDAPRRVPKKYWIALGVCSLTLGVTWLASSAPPTPAGLAQRALTAEKPDDRQAALAQLCSLQSPEVVPLLRRLLKDTKDPDVLSDVMVNLGIRNDFESVPQLVAQLDDRTPKVQVVAFSTLTKILGPRVFQGLELREDNTPEKREQAKRLANEKYEAVKKMATVGTSQ